MNKSDTIFAIASGTGGAIALIRVSGSDALAVGDRIFRAASDKPLAQQKGYTLHYGVIVSACDESDGRMISCSTFDPAVLAVSDPANGGRCGAVPKNETSTGTKRVIDDRGAVIDDVLVSVFRAPHSYTGEDMVEISCHGSVYIKQQISQALIAAGSRMAEPGEFTVRAYLNGKIDLSQAEAVADLIASTDRATHALAANQMRGGYSDEFAGLRESLLHFASLLELELDFGEEDVTFADRTELGSLLSRITAKVEALMGSFSLGNAVKSGVGVAIVGSPNVGKSTLLNALLKEDRAMVSEIPGTTRDVIEEALVIDGVQFRFIDTAGIRETDDTLEKMGIERTYLSIGKARIVLLMVDAGDFDTLDSDRIRAEIMQAISGLSLNGDQVLGVVLNKIDKMAAEADTVFELAEQLGDAMGYEVISLSAKKGLYIDSVLGFLADSVESAPLYDGSTIVSNTRHYEALCHALSSLERASDGLSGRLSSDLLAQDIRESLYHIGTITGQITDNEILGTIFSKFCIGK